MYTLENKTCPFCHAEYGAVEEKIIEEKSPEVAPLEKKITTQNQKAPFKIWKNS